MGGRDVASFHGGLQKDWDRERMAVASLMQHAVELDVRKMLHQRKEWDREQVAVASLMQHAVELGVRKMLHHRKEWDRE